MAKRDGCARKRSSAEPVGCAAAGPEQARQRSHERGDDGDGDLEMLNQVETEAGEIVGDRPQRSIQGRNGRFEVNHWSSKTTWTLGSGAVSMTGALTAVDM
jgi:hypothetical protein